MKTNAAADERSGSSRPSRQIALKSFSRVLSAEPVVHRGDGFVPVMVAAAFIASAVILALD
jgi:hypothetical protein